MNLRNVLGFLLLILCTVYPFNHPEIKWYTVTSEHFSINYCDKTSPALYAAWKIAEETYNSLAPLFGYNFRNKIELTIADYDDYSNGWADYTSSSIMIWLPDSKFEYRGSNTWLRNVLSHEITHILTLETRKRMQMLDVVVNLDFATPSEELAVTEPFPRLTSWPNWMAEGIAQIGSEKMGNDCWDSRREMLLRTASMSKTLLTLDEMGNFSHNSHGNEMVYNQGYSLMKFLENHIGTEGIADIFKTGSEGRIRLNSYLTEKTGQPLEYHYARWKDSLEEHYSVVFPLPEKNKTLVYNKGIINSRPEISPDGRYWGWLSSGRDDAGETDLLICRTGKTEPEIRIRHAHTSWSFSADSRNVYFIRSRDPDRHGSYLNDVFTCNIEDGNTKRVTKNLRAYDIAVSPVNGTVSVITYEKGVFSISMLDINTGRTREIVSGEMGTPFIKCSWSHTDSTKFVAERVVNGLSQFSVYSTVSKDTKSLLHAESREESPCWAKDGRIYFNADYNGVFNIYSCKDDGSDLRRHTNVIGGCFSPVVSADGGRVIYSGYGVSGFTIEETGSNGEPYDIPSTSTCVFKTIPQPKGSVSIKSAPYNSHYGRSMLELQINGLVSFNNSLVFNRIKDTIDEAVYWAGAGIMKYRQDPLQKKSRTMSLAIGAVGMLGGADSSSDSNYRSISGQSSSFAYDKYRVKRFIVPGEGLLSEKFYKKDMLTNELKTLHERAAAESDESDDSSSSLNMMLMLQPGINLVNREGRATLQLDMYAGMAMMIIPYVLAVNSSMQWELSRTVSAGAALYAEMYPFSGYGLGEIPLSVAWSDLGTYNEDVNYNYGNYSQWTLNCGPQFVPVLSYEVDYYNDTTDTSVSVHNGLFAQTAFFHGFSIAKYLSLQLLLAGRIDFFDTKMSNDILDSADSKTYVQTSTGLNFVFPLVRNINSGSAYYFDNFYCSVGYALIGIADGEFLKDPSHSRDILTDDKYSDHAKIGHQVSLGLTLGHYRKYNYYKKFSLNADYEFLREKVYIKISSEF